MNRLPAKRAAVRIARMDSIKPPGGAMARAVRLLLAAGLALSASGAAAAEDPSASFPNRPIRMIVPFPAGGPSDIVARLIGQTMSQDWGQPVVIDNRPGANTIIGAQAAAKAAPDGYTLFMAIDSTLVMNQFVHKSLPYDPLEDFVPITLTAKTISVLAVSTVSGPKTVKELMARAKAQPGKLNYGAGTITAQLMGHLFHKAAGLDIVYVPFKGHAGDRQRIADRKRRTHLRCQPDRRAADRERSGARAGEARPRCAAIDGRHPDAGRGGRLARSRGHLRLARAGGAKGHAQADHREDPRRGSEGFERPGLQGEVRAHRQLPRDQHARCVFRLRPQGGKPLGEGDQGKRHQVRLREGRHDPSLDRACNGVGAGDGHGRRARAAGCIPHPVDQDRRALPGRRSLRRSRPHDRPENERGLGPTGRGREPPQRANTVLGAQQVAKAAPDGYTLLMAIDSTLTMNQYLYRTPPYDPFTDFVPVTLTAKTMQLLIVNAASDVKTVKELIAKAKIQPGKLNYGAGTITTKLTGHLFNKAAGIDTVLVPYNGSA